METKFGTVYMLYDNARDECTYILYIITDAKSIVKFLCYILLEMAVTVIKNLKKFIARAV